MTWYCSINSITIGDRFHQILRFHRTARIFCNYRLGPHAGASRISPDCVSHFKISQRTVKIQELSSIFFPPEITHVLHYLNSNVLKLNAKNIKKQLLTFSPNALHLYLKNKGINFHNFVLNETFSGRTVVLINNPPLSLYKRVETSKRRLHISPRFRKLLDERTRRDSPVCQLILLIIKKGEKWLQRDK